MKQRCPFLFYFHPLISFGGTIASLSILPPEHQWCRRKLGRIYRADATATKCQSLLLRGGKKARGVGGKVPLAFGRTGPQHLHSTDWTQQVCYVLGLGESGFCAGLKTGRQKEMTKRSLCETLICAIGYESRFWPQKDLIPPPPWSSYLAKLDNQSWARSKKKTFQIAWLKKIRVF